MYKLLCFVSVLLVAVAGDRRSLPPPCDSLIYCHGLLLDTVQMAGLYNDSKTFVDKKIKVSPNVTMERFNELMERTNYRPSKEDISNFVQNNFDEEGSEFDVWDPADWSPKPAFLERIKDESFQQWAKSLHGLWKELGRKMKPEVKENQELYSIIYVDHPIIVPGGRFREFYYWDSYWILEGLLLSEMKATAKGMVTNFLDIVERFGHIPNGGRVYYVMRSQPPLLIPMVKLILDDTDDIEFLKKYIHTMDLEFDFWMKNHTVIVEHEGTNYTLARYNEQSQGPRPESYKEDIDVARNFDTQDKKEELYAELKSAAESGWDFSSRWFIMNGTNKGNLTNIKTRSIIPVELNAIMCWNAQLMRNYHLRLNNTLKAERYRVVHAQFMDAIDRVLWNEDVGAWLDYNLESGRGRDYFYPTNVAPLWTESYDKTKKEYYVNRVINYLEKVKIYNYDGGVPTTFEHSGEQWDYPNAWPPLQYIVTMGLANTGVPHAMRLAYEMASKWVRSNYKVWQLKNAMLEKYDATIIGGFGGGGEYELQTGFGWTNGIVMAMLDRWGANLSAADAFDVSEVSHKEGEAVVNAQMGAGGVATALLVVTASIVAGALG